MIEVTGARVVIGDGAHIVISDNETGDTMLFTEIVVTSGMDMTYLTFGRCKVQLTMRQAERLVADLDTTLKVYNKGAMLDQQEAASAAEAAE